MNSSPDEVLLKHTNQFIAQSSFSQAKFVHDLLLPALIDAELEQPDDYKTAEDYEKWRSAKVRQINSILNGHTKIPLRWLWCWLDVLPSPYGDAARKELFAQGNALDISIQAIGAVKAKKSARADIPKLIREMADVMEASAVVAADGQYDDDDSPTQLRCLADEITDVIELCLTELLSINEASDLSGTRAGVIVEMCKTTK